MSVAQAKFVQETLVTDTVVYEVVGRTAKTLKLRRTQQGDVLHREGNGSAYPVVYTEEMPNPHGKTFSVRQRKDGTYRVGSSGKPLRTARFIDGSPVSRVDYSF